jgi:hypothetical protein
MPCRLRLVKLLVVLNYSVFFLRILFLITLFVHAGRRPGLVVRDCS